ncbi:UMP kinase [Patescibacteria group bacterium]|nr:UMP kinase [Patescibacteria group bacterium]
MSTFKETIIIGVGGSLLVPDAIDTGFIAQLQEMVHNLINTGYRVVLVPGGGRTARNYQHALKELGQYDVETLDWIGIKAIHLNGELLLHVFQAIGINPAVIHKPEEISTIDAQLVLKFAFKPGNSSDVGAVKMAQSTGAQKIINFSNISHVYNEDPRTNPDATPFDTLTWQEYRALIPGEWTPGLSAPFDPVAATLAEEAGITVAILGASIENLKQYLAGESFEGTIIS